MTEARSYDVLWSFYLIKHENYDDYVYLNYQQHSKLFVGLNQIDLQQVPSKNQDDNVQSLVIILEYSKKNKRGSLASN